MATSEDINLANDSQELPTLPPIKREEPSF